MTILKLEPGKKPEEADIPDTLCAMQEIVGGSIQALYPFGDLVALICNEEGKLLGLPLNRPLRHPETGAVYDIVCGTCFLCGAPPGSDRFASLTPEQRSYYSNYYREPELFVKTVSGFLYFEGGLSDDRKHLCLLPLRRDQLHRYTLSGG